MTSIGIAEAHLSEHIEKVNAVDIFHEEVDIVIIFEGFLQPHNEWMVSVFHDLLLVLHIVLHLVFNDFLLVHALQGIEIFLF